MSIYLFDAFLAGLVESKTAGSKYAMYILIMGPLILIGMTPLCLGGILRVDITVPIVAMQSPECV